MLARVLIPCAAVVVESKNNAQGQANEKKCRPSELPIYTPEKKVKSQELESPPEPGAIENTFATIRRNIFAFTSEVKAYERVAEDYIEQGIENADCKFLQTFFKYSRTFL